MNSTMPFQVAVEDGVQLFGEYWYPHHSLSSHIGDSQPLLVCVHPWSKLGGSSDNMVDIAIRMSRKGIGTITFNCRGVGQSTGWPSFTGSSEIKDVAAVCKWAVKNLNAHSIVLLGFSAGASIAGSAIDSIKEVKAYVGIAYVFGRITSILFGRHYNSVLNSSKPKLFIQGEKDGFTSVSTFSSYVEKAKDPKVSLVIPGVGHFNLGSAEYDILIANICAFLEAHHLIGSA